MSPSTKMYRGMMRDPIWLSFISLCGGGVFGMRSLFELFSRGPTSLRFIADLALAASCAYMHVKWTPGGQMRSALKAKPDNPGCGPGKFAIVTGANCGVGKATARQLGMWGLKVVVGCRDIQKGEEAVKDIKAACPDIKGTFEVIQLDLSDMESVKKFAKQINDKDVKVDLLVNNAGIMMLPKLQTVKSVHNLELQFVTNHVGHYLLTRLLMPRIASCGGRVINLSSLGHVGAPEFTKDYYLDMTAANYDGDLAYFMSKQCNIRFARELNRKFDAMAAEYPEVKPATSYSAHPGGVRTELARHLPPSAKALNFFCKNPDQGAQTSLFLCSADREDVRPGGYYADCRDDAIAEASRGADADNVLWTWTEELVKAQLS